MIIKGTSVKSRKHSTYLANHLLNANDNEICEVWDIDGHAKPNDLKAAIGDFYDMVSLTRGGKNGLFMLSFNPEMGEKMSKENYFHAIAEAEKRFGLEGQPKAVVRHFKRDRDHIHVVWQTTDTETRKIKPNIYFFKRKSMALARDLEMELGHKRVSNEKSFKSYSDKDRERAKIDASQLQPDKRKMIIQEAFKNSKNSFEFTESINSIGLSPAKGKVGICLVDVAGQSYNLEKELKKTVSQKDLSNFFKSQSKVLPNVDDLIKAQNSKELNKQRTKKSKAILQEGEERKASYINYDFQKERFQKKAIEAGNNFLDITKDNRIEEAEKKKLEIIERSEELRKRKKGRTGFEI
jgi:Relaxase/Mobilisation nuclease domain